MKAKSPELVRSSASRKLKAKSLNLKVNLGFDIIFAGHREILYGQERGSSWCPCGDRRKTGRTSGNCRRKGKIVEIQNEIVRVERSGTILWREGKRDGAEKEGKNSAIVIFDKEVEETSVLSFSSSSLGFHLLFFRNVRKKTRKKIQRRGNPWRFPAKKIKKKMEAWKFVPSRRKPKPSRRLVSFTQIAVTYRNRYRKILREARSCSGRDQRTVGLAQDEIVERKNEVRAWIFDWNSKVLFESSARKEREWTYLKNDTIPVVVLTKQQISEDKTIKFSLKNLQFFTKIL